VGETQAIGEVVEAGLVVAEALRERKRNRYRGSDIGV
jgi:hypothetical protein